MAKCLLRKGYATTVLLPLMTVRRHFLTCRTPTMLRKVSKLHFLVPATALNRCRSSTLSHSCFCTRYSNVYLESTTHTFHPQHTVAPSIDTASDPFKTPYRPYSSRVQLPEPSYLQVPQSREPQPSRRPHIQSHEQPTHRLIPTPATKIAPESGA